MKQVKDICISEKYTGKDGKEKTTWKRIGTFFQAEDGKQFIKLDFIPVSGWNGFASVFEQKAQTQQGGQPQQTQQQQGSFPF